MNATQLFDAPALPFRYSSCFADLKELCPDPRIIIDAGAGGGAWAKCALETWPDAQVHSFEPCQRFNLSLQPGERHKVCRMAVAAESGRALLNLTHGPESNSFLDFLPGGPLEKVHAVIGREEVQVVTLDSIYGLDTPVASGDVGILKLDLQGSEFDALAGAEQLIRKHRPVIFTEVCFQPLYAEQPVLADMDAFLAELGYRRLYLYPGPAPDLWGDAIYVPDLIQDRQARFEKNFGDREAIRLNIGAGDTKIPGFTPIDRKFGTEAYPLNYADGSVEEIRCVHMLEHLSYKEVLEALAEWKRVLKPGGLLRISVPDVGRVIASRQSDPNWAYYLMGGQTDANDFHKSAYDEERLRAYLLHFGFCEIQKWASQNTDLAAADFSLNLQGRKPLNGPSLVIGNAPASIGKTRKIRAILGCPRVSWTDAAACFDAALQPLGIPIARYQGCFWGQNVQNLLEQSIEDGLDWILTLDYDSMITKKHVQRMLEIFDSRPDIDALAALQMRRGQECPLFTKRGGKGEAALAKLQVDPSGNPEPVQVDTAHFGLTLIRLDRLKDIPKPWLHAVPDKDGSWGDGRRDDDITFWDKWKAAGRSVYLAPDVRIGHIEVVVSQYSKDYQPEHLRVDKWWNENGGKSVPM